MYTFYLFLIELQYITRRVSKLLCSDSSLQPFTPKVLKQPTILLQSTIDAVISKAPKNVQQLLRSLPIPFQGIDLSKIPPLFMTEKRRNILMEQGFLSIPQVIDLTFIEELKRYILLKYRSEKIDDQSY